MAEDLAVLLSSSSFYFYFIFLLLDVLINLNEMIHPQALIFIVFISCKKDKAKEKKDSLGEVMAYF